MSLVTQARLAPAADNRFTALTMARLLFALLAMSAAAVVAPAAHASRPATPEEAAPIYAEERSDAQCVRVVASTAEPRWFASEDTFNDGCPPTFEIVVYRQTDNGEMQQEAMWRAGQLGPCPDAVPFAVAVDLLECRGPIVGALCANRQATFREIKRKPRRCNTLGATQSFAEGANLADLRWRNWGRSSATATGRELGYHRPLIGSRARVRAYRLREADCGDRVYTRFRVTTRHGRRVHRFPAVCADGDYPGI